MIPRLLLLALLAALPLPALAGPPSFDCASAKLPVEKAICRSPTLAALDVEIAEAYGRAMQALSNDMRTTLRDAQRVFLAGRDDAFGFADEDLEARLADQITFLKGIETRGRATIEGSWRNGVGGVEITLRPDGRAEVYFATAEPARARWLCDLQGEAAQSGGEWVVEGDPALLEGWSVRFAVRDGQMIVTSAPTGTPGAQSPPPFCGFNGSIDGAYLPVRSQPNFGP